MIAGDETAPEILRRRPTQAAVSRDLDSLVRAQAPTLSAVVDIEFDVLDDRWVIRVPTN
jgi:hypothetical protein